MFTLHNALNTLSLISWLILIHSIKEKLFQALMYFSVPLIIIYCITQNYWISTYFNTHFISIWTRKSMCFDLPSRLKWWPPSASLLPTASLSSSLSSTIRCLALSKTDFKTMESSKIWDIERHLTVFLQFICYIHWYEQLFA